jgi:hypothetical protein
MYPPETLKNILYVSCKNNLFSLASDILKTHTESFKTLIKPLDLEFLETYTGEQAGEVSPAVAAEKYEKLIL